MAYFTDADWWRNAASPQGQSSARALGRNPWEVPLLATPTGAAPRGRLSQALDVSVARLGGRPTSAMNEGLGILPLALVAGGTILGGKTVANLPLVGQFTRKIPGISHINKTFSEGGSTHNQRAMVYGSAWAQAKKQVQDGLSKIQPAFDKIEAQAPAVIDQLAYLQGPAIERSPAARQAVARARQAAADFNDQLDALRTLVEDFNAKVRTFTDAEAVSPSTAPPPGSDGQIALDKAKNMVAGILRALPRVQSKIVGARKVVDSATLIVNRENKRLMDEASAMAAKQRAQEQAFQAMQDALRARYQIPTPSVWSPSSSYPGSVPLQVQTPLAPSGGTPTGYDFEPLPESTNPYGGTIPMGIPIIDPRKTQSPVDQYPPPAIPQPQTSGSIDLSLISPSPSGEEF
jgi:hypothetical protein